MSSRWPIVPVAEVLTEYREYIDAPEARLYPKLSVKLYGRGVTLDTPADGATLRMKRHQIAKCGQVILSEIWGKKGAIGIVPKQGDGALCTSHFFLFDVNTERVHPGWLQAIFRANYLEPQLDVQAFGTTGYAAVRPQNLLAAKISLPPLPEQRRIVTRIEELASKIEEARQLHHQTVVESEAILPSAAIELFNSISNAPRLPIESVAEVRGGIQKGPHRAPGANPVRYLTVAHVQRNHISLSDPRFFEVNPEELNRWRLEAGDVLIIEGNGSPEQIGRTALFRGEIRDCVHQNHVIRIRPNREVIDPEFLNSYLNGPLGQDEVHSRSRTTSGLRNLSIGRIKEIALPVPSLDEQHRILTHLATMREKLDELKRLQAETAAELDALLPSILDKAFKGEL